LKGSCSSKKGVEGAAVSGSWEQLSSAKKKTPAPASPQATPYKTGDHAKEKELSARRLNAKESEKEAE
jgi:hypothetical protein